MQSTAFGKTPFTQLLRIMKVSALLLLFVLQVAARPTVSAQVTLKETSASLEKVLKAIKKQSDYGLSFDEILIRSKGRPVAVNVDNVPVEEALRQVFKSQDNLTYTLNGRIISIKEKKGEPITQGLNPGLPPPPINIKGRVTDENGKPVEGAAVQVKGSNKGTTTKANGEWQLQGVDENAILVVSSLNIETKEIKVNGKTDIAISITTRITELAEVAVVNNGYQVINRERLTGAVSSISGATYHQSIPVTGNILTNLEGRLPGLVYNPNTGTAKGGGLTIRGVSTLRADAKPLIILNGFPTEIDLDNIEPYDIESIDVLKDAAAAAIYGVRSSNGVIVIVTKKGSAGAPRFQFTTAATVQSLPDFSYYQYLSGKDFVEAERLKAISSFATNGNSSRTFYDANNINYTPVFGAADDLKNGRITQAQADAIYAQYGAYDNTADYKRLFLQNPVLSTVALNISGGSENASYLFGVSRQDNKLGQQLNGNDRTVLNYRGTFKFLSRLSLDVQSFYTNGNAKSAPSPAYSSFRPYQRFVDDNGNPVSSYFQAPINGTLVAPSSTSSINDAQANRAIAKGLYDPRYYPYQELTATNGKTQTNVYHFQASLTARLVKGLNLELGGMYEKQLNTQVTLAGENAFENRTAMNLYAVADPTTGKPVFQFPQGGVKYTTNNTLTSHTLRAQLIYNNTFKRHAVTALLGIEQRQIVSESNLSTAFGYDPNTLTYKPMNLSLFTGQQPATPFINDISIINPFFFGYNLNNFFNETFVDNRFVSSYGNAAYTYNQKYTATGSFRIDQSNLFGTDPKFRYVPLWSAGVLWAARKESFLSSLNWLDKLNLRASIGYNGNTASGAGPFTTIKAGNNVLSQPNPILGYSISSPINNSLRWEKTLNYNVGLDFSLFKGKTFGSIDYYIKNSRDLIEMMNIDPTTGGNGTGIVANNASVRNRGLEVAVNTVIIRNKNFSWSTQVTGSFNNNKVTGLNFNFIGNSILSYTSSSSSTKVIGYPLSPVFAFRYAGLNTLGQPTVYDTSGKTVVQKSTALLPVSAAEYIGTTVPRYVIGFNNQFTFHDFELNFLIMYYGGHVGYVSSPDINAERPIQGALNFWQKPGDELTANNPGFLLPSTDPRYFDGTAYTTFLRGNIFFKKMDYIALRNVTLSYHLDHVMHKWGLSNTKIRLQVQNPFKYVFNGEHIDPETMDLKVGTRALPVVQSYTFSISTNF